MRDKIRQLGSDTAVYGVSTVVGRFLNFLLVPFYTNVLLPGEYGVVAYIYSIIAFLNIVYGYGMESAYFRYGSSLELGSEKENFTTPFISLAATSLLLSGFIHIFASPISALLDVGAGGPIYVRFAGWILFFDTVSIIPFAFLRLKRRAKLFAVIRLANIVLNVILNLVLLLKFHLGVEGIFISGIASSALTVVLLYPTIFSHIRLRSVKGLYRALLKFGLPYVPAGMAAMVMQVVDRPILKALTNDATVGIYQANYRLGILMMLAVSVFDYAWRPFFLANAKEEDAKRLYAKVLTYFLFAAMALWLVGSLFVDDVVRIRFLGRSLIHPAYWSGLGIVPIVLLAYVFTGISTNLIAGIYIEKKTNYLPWVNGAGAAVNIIANFALIPLLSLHGAAIATLLSYVVTAILMFYAVQRVYPVRYEYGRLAKLFVVSLALYGIYRLVPFEGVYSILWKVGLTASFIGLLGAVKFFREDEFRQMWRLFRRRTVSPSPADVPSDTIK